MPPNDGEEIRMRTWTTALQPGGKCMNPPVNFPGFRFRCDSLTAVAAGTSYRKFICSLGTSSYLLDVAVPEYHAEIQASSDGIYGSAEVCSSL